jgi:chlorobactene glucosyltransferase
VIPAWGLWALPWVVVAIFFVLRWRTTAGLEAHAPEAFDEPTSPLVSIVVPARNEARNIERCMRSILASEWKKLELIVVNDHSTDGTGEIARRIAAEDSRVTVIDAPDLPAGWFGKQWACHNGVQRAKGQVFLFTDADTKHGPLVLPRSLRVMRERGAALFSVHPGQEYGTFWERLLMPQVIALIVLRYGNTETMNRSTNPLVKLANGQFLMISREWYNRVGGHEAVRTHVAEDLRLAQVVCGAGGNVQVLDGRGEIETRMYQGLGELMVGWSKNIYAGGRDTIQAPPIVHAVFRVFFPVPMLWNVAPVVVSILSLGGLLSPPFLWWAVTAYLASVAFWLWAYAEQRVPVWYALLHPIAGAMMFALCSWAAWRGSRVEWKGREYESKLA